ncbi:MAG: arginine deiminase-related protein [Steroidobacteraceae bacterium]|nr:arginine deiminase-related protein [Steroidobacteraceae bacterium]
MSPPADTQCAGAVLLVRPATFASNPETLATNRFQGALAPGEFVREAVLHEFDQLAGLLADEVRVHVVHDTPEPPKPDAVFPNNWFSTHADGTVVLYPMLAPSRRAERRRELVDALATEGPYRIARVVDLSHFELQGAFLEGTGSLVLDRVAHVAYACRSPRTHAAPLAAFARAMGYEIEAFDAVDDGGTPIYHTNVVMWIGDGIAAIGAEAIADREQRRRVLDRLSARHEVVELSHAQLAAFAGNALALRGRDGSQLLEMSHRAFHALTDTQRATIRRHARWLTAHPVYTIERLGGGSVRCMLAEVFLPPA